VEQAVQDEDLEFDGRRVALLNGLLPRRGNADGEISCDLFVGPPFLVLDECLGGEGKDVCGFVDSAELAIEAADGCIAGENDVDLASQANCGL
jgi:hypothetical protein